MEKSSVFKLSEMVLPAATKDLLPILIGAIKAQLDPMNTLSPIKVLFLFLPSKLQVIVPAPILVLDPMILSPMYVK